MVHSVTCINCNNTTETREHFLDIFLAIDSESEEKLTHNLVRSK